MEFNIQPYEEERYHVPCLIGTSMLILDIKTVSQTHFTNKPGERIKIVCFVSVCVCDKSFKSAEGPGVALLIHLSRFIGSSVCKVALSVLLTSQLPLSESQCIAHLSLPFSLSLSLCHDTFFLTWPDHFFSTLSPKVLQRSSGCFDLNQRANKQNLLRMGS